MKNARILIRSREERAIELLSDLLPYAECEANSRESLGEHYEAGIIFDLCADAENLINAE